MFDLGDKVFNSKGIAGTVVSISKDYSFADKADPVKMARLIFVKFDDEAILIPETRVSKRFDVV